MLKFVENMGLNCSYSFKMNYIKVWPKLSNASALLAKGLVFSISVFNRTYIVQVVGKRPAAQDWRALPVGGDFIDLDGLSIFLV